MVPSDGAVIGIDVGCSPQRKSSAVCRLSWTNAVIRWEIERFRATEEERSDAIDRFAGGRRILAAALDGPLRKGFDVIGRYRTAERLLTRRLQPIIGKPGQSSAPIGKSLNHHANECARKLLSCAYLRDANHSTAIDPKAIVEAFPSSFLGMMIGQPKELAARRGDRSDTFYQHLAATETFSELVAHCLPGRTLAVDFVAVTNHDDRAALVCALTALCVAAGDFVAVGDEDGWIVLPPKAFIKDRQWALLSENAKEETRNTLYVSR